MVGLDKKGFTLLELLAVIVLATAIMFPMVNALLGNYEVNVRMHSRKAASSMSITTMYAFGKFEYGALRTLLEDNLNDYEASEYGEDGYYVLLNKDACYRLPDPYAIEVEGTLNEYQLCSYIYDQEWNNFSYDSDHFQTYLYPYYLDTATKENLLDSSLPNRVKDHIRSIPVCDGRTSCDPNDLSAMRISVWIRYSDTSEGSVVASNGLLTDTEGISGE